MFDCEAIFTVSGDYPEVTYVDRDATLTKQLSLALDHHRVAIIKGLSKTGKTLLIHHTLRYSNVPRIWLSGGRINSVEDFWKAIRYSLQKTGNKKIASGLEQIVSALRQQNYCIIVDDFHYIGTKEVRDALSRIFKGLSEIGVTVFVIGVQSPPMREIEEMPDLMARSLIITLDSWSEDDLSRIGHKGFTRCGFGIANIGALAQESFGSPFLMQKLCQTYCARRVSERPSNKLGYIERVEREEIDSILRNTAQSISYMNTYEVLVSPAALATNEEFLRHDGQKVGNLNQIILYAISGRHPFGAIPLLEVHVGRLWQRVCEVLDSASEVSAQMIWLSVNAMLKEYREYYKNLMVQIDGPRFDPVIDQVGQIFFIRDPFLLFYLRHSDEIEAQFATY